MIAAAVIGYLLDTKRVPAGKSSNARDIARLVATDTVAITKIKDSKIVCSRRHHAPALRAGRHARHKAVACKGCELFRLAQSALRQGNHRARISFAWQDVRRVAELTEPKPDLDKASSMRQFQRQRQHRPRPWQHFRPLRPRPSSKLCFEQ